jgi:hypothetical protein
MLQTPLPDAPTISVFGTDKIQGGQDRVSYVQWFDIEDEQMLQWSEQRAREVHVVKGEMILYPLSEG